MNAPARTRMAAKSIGESLQSWRKLYGISSQELADRAGVSRATVSRLENGDPSVSLATFLNVCGILQIEGRLIDAVDPYETEYGRIRADEELPKRVRR
ncbi:helix-turn-helix transcriptional regulator [Parvibacter caecicola]|uniref:Helix-turn-helix transcriptional regulator n=1 Tax=Parvibacter caecicola TaxID=747645 RepID=A0A4T9T7R2_9ACTN|nr:helix-turn-helix transcriptional regulator [Parvibacter caecicola]TJW10794.1 helix-turn-helix transcriptional regulator [Parvibacter caecicola]